MKSWQSIIVLAKEGKIELWGSLTELCREHPDFKYQDIKQNKFPFVYKGWDFNKVQYRKKAE